MRRWKLSLATMANSTDSMRSAKRYCEMRPGTITEIRNACFDREKSFSVLFVGRTGAAHECETHYPSEEFIFSSYGCDLHIDNELCCQCVCRSAKSKEQSILILFLCSGTGRWRDWRPHGECPGSAVQRHRAKTLNELRKS